MLHFCVFSVSWSDSPNLSWRFNRYRCRRLIVLGSPLNPLTSGAFTGSDDTGGGRWMLNVKIFGDGVKRKVDQRLHS